MFIWELLKQFWNAFKARQEPDRPSPEEKSEELPEEKEEETPAIVQAVKTGRVDLKASYNEKRLWYKPAIQSVKQKSRGKYAKGYPEGLVVHFNAGRHNPASTMQSGVKNGYLYLAMGRDGTILQGNNLTEWGYHAGKSAWKINGKTVSGVSARFAGIEISAAGLVKKNSDGTFAPWYAKKASDMLKEDQVRFAKKGQNITGNGYWEKYSPEQEEALIEFCLWLKANNPSVFNFDNVVGHDEVAVPFGRKNDPGGALSMTMPEFRALLKKRYAELGLK